MDVSLQASGVTTEATSISYHRSAEMRSQDWIFRYEYLRDVQEDYPYPVAHLHVNAVPEHYRGSKPFSRTSPPDPPTLPRGDHSTPHR